MDEERRINVHDLKRQVAESLEKLQTAMGWTKKTFAEKIGISAPSLSKYMSPDSEQIPDLECLVNLCAISDFQKKGLELSIDALLSPNFDPVTAMRRREGKTNRPRDSIRHGDFVGCYLCYFFDQAKSTHEQDFKATRAIRYGVAAIYDDYGSLTGDAVIRVFAAFFKDPKPDEALKLKRELDTAFSLDKGGQNIAGRNNRIRDILSGVSGLYGGEVKFSEQHAFLTVHSDVHSDQALIILYAPHKRADSDYVGGIGSVTSVARGSGHMPTAQKLILSKYELGCSNEEIAEHLSMSNAPVSSGNEAKALGEICKKLYGSDGAVGYLDENDKNAILANRMNQLVRNYIEKNVCCVGSVSEDEDRKVFDLIKRFEN